VDYYVDYYQAPIARGIHGLLKVSLGLAMPNPSMPCGRATPKNGPYGCFGGGLPAGLVACVCLLPPWIPNAVRAWFYVDYRDYY